MRISALCLLGLATGCAAPEPIGADLGPEGPGSFTIPRKTGAFVIYGDSRQKVGLEVWRANPGPMPAEVTERIARESPDFVVHSGDLVACGDDAECWKRCAADLGSLTRAGIPVFAALGNHEYSGDRSAALRTFFEHFPWLGKNRWYALRYEPVLLLVLDSNDGYLAQDELARELDWLESSLVAAERDPRVSTVILVAHAPPYTNAAVHSGSTLVREEVLGRAAKHGKVRAIFSGHTHSYERFEKHGIQCVVSGGGGAPLMSVIATSPTSERDWTRGRRSFHFCRIRLEPSPSCEVVMRSDDGSWSVVDRFGLSGAPPADT